MSAWGGKCDTYPLRSVAIEGPCILYGSLFAIKKFQLERFREYGSIPGSFCKGESEGASDSSSSLVQSLAVQNLPV